MIHPSAKALVSFRVSGAVMCNITLHWILLILFIFLANGELFNFVLWAKSIVSFHFSFRFWIFAAPLAIVTVAQGIVSCKEYVMSPTCPGNRISSICHIFSVYNIVVCALYAYIGLSLPLIYTSVEENEFSSFEIPCGSNLCLSEDRLFLALGGLWIGFYYFVQNHVFSFRYLEFPILQQKKSVMVKSSIIPALKTSCKHSLVPIILYLALYYFEGRSLREFFTHFFNYHVQSGNLDSLFLLLSPKRFLHLWFFSTLTIFTLKMMEATIRIYLMQRYEFVMYHTPAPSTHFIMEEALARSDVPIIRHLAFWDLALLSENDKVRRKDIYTLSHPGGHPYTWRGIKKQCFDAIDNFTLSLEEAVKKPVLSGQCTSPQTLKPHRYEATEYFASSKESRPFFCTETFSSTLRYIQQSVLNYLFAKLASAGESRPVRFFFGVVPKHRVNYMVLHSLPVAWAAESLSFLLCASLSEDAYGVLQSDIPVVITTLLRLQTALDSLHKNLSVLRKFHSSRSDPVTKMHNTLTSKVKRSLYYLAINFKPFISDLQLSRNDEVRLLAYCSFKE